MSKHFIFLVLMLFILLCVPLICQAQNENAETGLPKIVFLHYPPVAGERECGPIMDVLRESGITRCYYGHLHGNSISHAFEGERDGISFHLISADALHFTPQLIEKY